MIEIYVAEDHVGYKYTFVEDEGYNFNLLICVVVRVVQETRTSARFGNPPKDRIQCGV